VEQHLFYSPGAGGPACFLPPDESRHAIKVLRMKQGDGILLTDGLGNFYEGEIAGEDPKNTRVVVKREFGDDKQRNYRLHIAIAPTKNISRFEWFLEKATEIGIDEITPVLCDHSERRVIKKERLLKIIVAAAKQSFKPLFPVLNDLKPLQEVLSNNAEEEKFLAWLDREDPIHLKTKYSKGNNVLILVGPEGDFSEEEINQAKKNGFVTVSLGDYRLRTETAGVVACHAIAMLNQ
jgi:16S rRNA (uracil1498-N3)-methyltransferase